MEKQKEHKKWNRIYSLVIGFLALQIILYYLFTLTFR